MPHRRNTPELKAFVSDLYAPSSPGFLQFLSFNEWKTRFGPSDQDLAAIEAWAAAVGLRETHRSRANLELVFEADVKTVQSSFGIVLNEYEAEGRHFFSNDRDVVLPSPLRGLVDDVVGLESYSRVHSGVRDDLAFVDQTVPRVEGSDRVEHRLQSNGMPRASVVPLRSRSGRPATVAKRTAPLLTGPNPTWIEPTDLWPSWGYDYDALAKLSHCCNPTSAPGGSPKESSIAIVGGNKPQWSDVTAFYNAYGLAANVTQIEIWGPSCCSSEMTLDASYAGAMSNSFGAWSDTAQIFDYEGGSLLISDLLDAWEWAFEDDKARVLSSSFGSAESAYGSFLDLTTPGIGDFVYVTYGMASTGWTMLVAAGDDGETADCATYSVQYPGSDPNVITVGGTTLTLNAANGVFQSEYAWSGLGCPNLGGGGGGCSSAFQWSHSSRRGNKTNRSRRNAKADRRHHDSCPTSRSMRRPCRPSTSQGLGAVRAARAWAHRRWPASSRKPTRT